MLYFILFYAIHNFICFIILLFIVSDARVN